MSGEQHISSLVVLHRPDGAAVLREFTAAHGALQIAAQGDCRCVLLCETDDQRVRNQSAHGGLAGAHRADQDDCGTRHEYLSAAR